MAFFGAQTPARQLLKVANWRPSSGCVSNIAPGIMRPVFHELLKWAFENGAQFRVEGCAIAASANGHLTTLQYLMSCSSSWTEYDQLDLSIVAANNGDLQVLHWLHAEQWLDSRCLAVSAAVEGT